VVTSPLLCTGKSVQPSRRFGAFLAINHLSWLVAFYSIVILLERPVLGVRRPYSWPGLRFGRPRVQTAFSFSASVCR
jgi:hypothetical protein